MISGKEIIHLAHLWRAAVRNRLFFHLPRPGSRGQWLEIHRLLCFPVETDVKVSVKVQLHCQQLERAEERSLRSQRFKMLLPVSDDF